MITILFVLLVLYSGVQNSYMLFFISLLFGDAAKVLRVQSCEDGEIQKTVCKSIEGCQKASTDKKDSLAHGDKLGSYFFTPYI